MAADLAGTTSTNAMCRERLLRWPYVVFHARDCALVPFHSRRNCASPRATVMGLRARWTWSRHGGILNVFVPGARQYSLIPRRYCRWQGRRGPDDHLPPQHVQTLTPFSSVCGARAHIPEHAPVRRWSSCFPPWNSENLLRGKFGVECTVYDPELFRREILRGSGLCPLPRSWRRPHVPRRPRPTTGVGSGRLMFRRGGRSVTSRPSWSCRRPIVYASTSSSAELVNVRPRRGQSLRRVVLRAGLGQS
jgi:hypothetical protein